MLGTAEAARIIMNELPEWLKYKTDSLPEGRYIAGISGGADSTALIHLFAGITRDEHSGIRIEAVHVNHGLRGAESDGDEAFVRDLCRSLQIPVHVYHVDLGGKHDENSAREARFRCFRERMAETGADALLLAHNADDLAETFLMRLIRGAGPEGLSCMKRSETVCGMRIMRPMLRLTRAEIREALKESSIPWREDSTNDDPSYLRNNIRMNILPRMEEMNPGAALRIARAAEFIAADNDALNSAAETFLRKCAGPRWIRPDELAELPEALKSRILRMWWKQNTPPLDEHELNAAQTGQLVSLTGMRRGKINMPGGLYAVRGKQAIHITGLPRENFPETAFDGKSVCCGRIRLEVKAGEGSPGNGSTEQEIPSSFLDGCVIRTRRAGDWIAPFGMSGRKKLQDYFVDKGIDEPWRDEIPLICRDREVLFAAGVGAGNIPRWDNSCDNIRITWSGEMPWINHP